MRKWIVAAALSIAGELQAQLAASSFATPADRSLITQLVALEDSRQLPSGASDARLRALASANPSVRAFSVRGLGRLEKLGVTDTIARMLADPAPRVRSAAAHALAQSVASPVPAAASPDDRARASRAVDRARAALTTRLRSERDAGVRAAVLESLGRLPQGSVEVVKATANAIAPSLAASVPLVERQGAIRGIFFLARKREARAAGVIPIEVTDRLYAMLREPPSAGFTPTDRYNMAFALNGVAALDVGRSRELIDDANPFVRDRAVAALSRMTDPLLIRTLVEKGMQDRAAVVRFRALNVYAQRLRGSCAPIIAMTRDTSTTVALAAVDALSGCRDDSTVARHLHTLASAFADDERWHLPVHAFVALSVVDSAAARPMLSRFMRAQNFFVRMYADTAARLMGDVTSLYVLSRDPHPNVQASAITGLSHLVGHAADSVYLRALNADDNQLVMAASAALKGSTMPGVIDSVREALERHRDAQTQFDGWRALEDLYYSLRQVLGNRVFSSSVRMPVPTFDELAALERATGRIEMTDGSVITIRFHPFDAPTNVARFVRLARGGVFDGLTFHRVAPFFVVQGLGPNANEYSAPDAPYARDELGLSNVRGTIGLSTRGRDTGDGQIYINTVDNVWLDHDYTVMATITGVLEAFDRMQEGARVRRVTITP